MFRVTLPADRAMIDMAAVARAFGISIMDLENGIRVGTIGRWFEVREGDQDNKPRQIFASDKLGLRVDADEHGNVRSVSKYEVPTFGLQPKRVDARHGNDTAMQRLAHDVPDNPDTARHADLEALLDEALDESFPASDPIAISF